MLIRVVRHVRIENHDNFPGLPQHRSADDKGHEIKVIDPDDAAMAAMADIPSRKTDSSISTTKQKHPIKSR